MTKSPDAFRTISEVADALETPAHVLRFWESRFPQIKPVKRAGGRRYYRPADVALLTGIKRLLHDDGLTIRGVQKILREQGVRFVSGGGEDAPEEDGDTALVTAMTDAGDQAAEPDDLPPAEVETAQIIALQTALRPAASPDQADDARDPPAPVQIVSLPPAPVVADLFSRLTPPEPESEPEAEPEAQPDLVAEAPMTLWAEEAPADPPPPAPVVHLPRFTPTPEVEEAALPTATLAYRLRALRSVDLASEDLAALADLRDRAADLYAHLTEVQAAGAGQAGFDQTPG